MPRLPELGILLSHFCGFQASRPTYSFAFSCSRLEDLHIFAELFFANLEIPLLARLPKKHFSLLKDTHVVDVLALVETPKEPRIRLWQPARPAYFITFWWSQTSRRVFFSIIQLPGFQTYIFNLICATRFPDLVSYRLLFPQASRPMYLIACLLSHASRPT